MSCCFVQSLRIGVQKSAVHTSMLHGPNVNVKFIRSQLNGFSNKTCLELLFFKRNSSRVLFLNPALENTDQASAGLAWPLLSERERTSVADDACQNLWPR